LTLCITLETGRIDGGGVDCCPDMIAMSLHMALTYLIFSVVDVGTLLPRALKRSAATAMERYWCKVIWIWQWVGYRHHVLEKRKCCIAGM
jgi:hypothetical protein